MRNVGALAVGLMLLVLVALNNPVTVVDEGHVGLITELGRAKELRGPGVTLINPFIQDLKEVEITNQAREKANQAIETAKGQGDAALELARRQAEANQLLSQSLSNEVLRNKELDKWDGKLPQVQTGGSGSVGGVGGVGGVGTTIMVPAPSAR